MNLIGREAGLMYLHFIHQVDFEANISSVSHDEYKTVKWFILASHTQLCL